MKTTGRIQIQGTVQAFNISPKGSYEGVLVKSKSKLLQVNFPQELAQRVAEVAPVNHSVSIQAVAEEPSENAAHPVYRLISLVNVDGETVDGQGDGQFSGRVVRLNYALHGETNGAILDSGDFLHLKPHGAAAVNLKAGMKVSGKGEIKPSIGAHRVIEAEEVNGIHLGKKQKKQASH